MRHDLEVLMTERMAAVRISESDFAELRRMDCDVRVMATLGGIRSEAQTSEFLLKAIQHWHRYRYGIWIFRERDGQRFLGRAGLRHVELEGTCEVELLYAVMAEFWGKGFATEMARAIVKLGFECLGLESVVAFTLPANFASRRVMEKAGFSYERESTWAATPHVLYRLKNPAR
jgi:ribosomal-protein-alanine N-acetyltransferase